MSEPNAQEPTMEEILASIRRIISEDEPAEGSPDDQAASILAGMGDEAEAPAAEADDTLLLTERVEEPAVETIGDLDLYPPADARPASDLPELPPIAEGAPLVSEPVAAEAASVFGQLAQRVVMPREGRTLEDVVREMLNPMLKAWLDQYLPAIVEAKVEEEVQRIARRHVG